MRLTMTMVCFSMFCFAGCIIVTSKSIPTRHEEYDKLKTHYEKRLLNDKPSLSISVVRAEHTSIDDGEVCTKIQNKLKRFFQRTKCFDRIITGEVQDYCQYRIRLLFCENRRVNDDPNAATLHGLFLCTIPMLTDVYDSEYTLIYEGEGKCLASQAFYHKDIYSWLPGLILGPITYFADSGPANSKILKSLVKDIQNQGGFSELELNLK